MSQPTSAQLTVEKSTVKFTTSGWYSNEHATDYEQILETTYAHAKILLRTLVTPKDYESLFPTRNTSSDGNVAVLEHTLHGVQRCLRDAKTAYETTSTAISEPFDAMAPTTLPVAMRATSMRAKAASKTRELLEEVSRKVVLYGNIFDVLVQHHPEYVSLAWGTFKLLFTAVVNHAETTSKLSKSLSQIADLLPQHQLHLMLYPTPQMQAAVARLYARIIHFFMSSIKWYQNSRAMHALKSIFQPWELKFKPEYDAIAAEALQVRRLADTAMKAEVRDTRLEVVQGSVQMGRILEEMSLLKAENQRLMAMFESRFTTMETTVLDQYQGMHSSICELKYDFNAQRRTLNEVHLSQMLALPIWKSLPTSGESLEFCRSMQRRRYHTRLSTRNIDDLTAWARSPASSILFLNTFDRAAAKSLILDLINVTLEGRQPLIWALRYPGYWDQPIQRIDIMRMLVLHAIQLCGGELLASQFPVTGQHLWNASTLQDWAAILGRVLAESKQHALIALDTDLLAHATNHERSLTHELLDMLCNVASGTVKIVISAASVGSSFVEELSTRGACFRLDVGEHRRGSKNSSYRDRSKRKWRY